MCYRHIVLSFLMAFAAECVGAADALSIRSDALGGVFTVAETPAVALSGNTDGRVVWRLLDWKREKLRIGEWPKGGQLSFEGLPQGYYFVQARLVDAANTTNIPLREATFCVVPDPKDRVYPFDAFYGVDAALSWVSAPQHYACNWYGDNSYRACLDLIRLSGLPHVRERLSWCEVSDKPGEYHWGKYLQNARFAGERGLKLSNMFHDSPKYAERMQKGPADMAALYRFCRDAGREFGDAVGDWEFWNEQNLQFWPEPVWDYMSAMKAAYLGFKSVNPKMIVLNGAPTGSPWDTFGELMFENDLAKYSNVFNIHNYGAAVGYPKYFEKLHSFMRRSGIADRQVWITESSTTMEGFATEEGLMPGMKAQSYAQEMVLAELYAKNRVYMQMQGVSRDYFFAFGAYSEMDGARDWGVQRRDGSVKPVYSAISTVTEQLNDAKIEGEVAVGEGVRCYAFRKPDGSQTLAYWSVSPCDVSSSAKDKVSERQLQVIDRDFSVPASTGTYLLSNWCGERSSVVSADGQLRLKASRYASFLQGVRGISVTTPAYPAGRIEEYRPADDEDLSVVIRIEFDKKDFVVSKNMVSMAQDTGNVVLRIWNFSDVEKTGSLESKGCLIEGASDEIRLPAGGIETKIAAALRFPDSVDAQVRLDLTGKFNGKRTSRLVVPVGSDRAMLARSRVFDVKTDVGFWKRNDSATEMKSSWDEKESAVRFDCVWRNPATDRWFYPVHTFGYGEETLDGASILEFEVKMETNKMENDVMAALCMLLDGKSEHGLHIEYPAPDITWERRRVNLTDLNGNFLGNGCKAFRLGCNPLGTRMTYWVRNLRIIKPK